MIAISIYNSTTPSAGDSNYTRRVKAILTEIIKNLLTKKGFKSWIREEVPLYYPSEPPYHLDIGVLTRNKEIADMYSFFGVEIDYKTHETKTSDNKDREKDKVFRRIGVPVYRIRVEKVIGERKWDLPTIESDLWNFFTDNNNWNSIVAEKNLILSIALKENQLTRCRNTQCKHPAAKHSLWGCNFQQPNKQKDYCPCREPHFVSDI